MKSCWPWRKAAYESVILFGTAFLLGIGWHAVHPETRRAWPRTYTLIEHEKDDAFLRLTLAETVQTVQARDRIVLDARSRAAWRTARIPGALPVPIEEAETALEHVRPLLTDPNERLLIYCARPGCNEGLRLARFLHDQGYRKIALYPDGFSTWRKAGLPVERSDEP